MESTISKVCHQLDSIVRYLTPLLPLANCHMVEFLTQNHWEKLLPGPLRVCLDQMDLNEAVDQFWKAAGDPENDGTTELDKWVTSARAHCVSVNGEYCLSFEQMQGRIEAWGGQVQPEVRIKEFMSSKKSYEVSRMCGLVVPVSLAAHSGCCVEAGGGRGALLAALSAHGLRSLTLDCQPATVRAAAERSHKIQKQWTAAGGSADSSPAPHRCGVAYLTASSDLQHIVREHFPELDPDVRIMLTGLHTCGNLGPDSLRIFAAQPAATALVNVPCCYHLLTEHLDATLYDVFQKNYGDDSVGSQGFPMSEYMRGYNLGRNARMLAAQSIDRVVGLRQLPARSLLYRALLQVIIKTHRPDFVAAEGKLKRINKCENFEQYFKMAADIMKLDLDLPEILTANDWQWKKLVLFYLLRLCLAQVVESVILLDRLLFLLEGGFEKVFLVKLFDPVLSPRCHSIVAIR